MLRPSGFPRNPAAQAARYLGQPALLLATAGAISWVLANVPYLDVASFAIAVTAFGFIALFERAIPFRAAWHPRGVEWGRDALYMTINVVVGTIVPLVIGIITMRMAQDTTGLPLAAEIPLAYLVASVVGYWMHRLGHDIGALWQLHGVHHAPEKVNAANNNTFHFLDIAVQTGPGLAALYVFGFSAEAVFAVLTFQLVLGFATHANADFRLGWLNYVIGGPERHRLHHSKELSEAGNFAGALPLWDLLFGTFTWRPGRAPVEVGVTDPGAFPDPISIRRNAAHPFRVWSQRRRETRES